MSVTREHIDPEQLELERAPDRPRELAHGALDSGIRDGVVAFLVSHRTGLKRRSPTRDVDLNPYHPGLVVPTVSLGELLHDHRLTGPQSRQRLQLRTAPDPANEVSAPTQLALHHCGKGNGADDFGERPHGQRSRSGNIGGVQALRHRHPVTAPPGCSRTVHHPATLVLEGVRELQPEFGAGFKEVDVGRSSHLDCRRPAELGVGIGHQQPCPMPRPEQGEHLSQHGVVTAVGHEADLHPTHHPGPWRPPHGGARHL